MMTLDESENQLFDSVSNPQFNSKYFAPKCEADDVTNKKFIVVGKVFKPFATI